VPAAPPGWLGWLLGGCCVAFVAVIGVLLRSRRPDATMAQEREALAAKTAQLEAALAGMSDGISMVGADLRLLAWNSKFAEIAGVPAEMLRVGLSAMDILRAQAEAGEFGAVDIEAEVTRRLGLIRAGGATGTVRRVRPGGRVLELRRSPIAGGGFVTLYTDITDSQRTEERMRQSERLAALGRVAAGIVHDFNNLLANIIGNAEVLERMLTADPDAQRHNDIILQSAERGADLVRRLLTFARRQQLEPVPADLNKIVQGMRTLLNSTTGEAVQIATMLAPDLWPALVDPVQMEHVILNLAINARDAMLPQGGVLTIATANLAAKAARPDDLPTGDFVCVSVRDTGSGMTEEVRRNAFEPFFTTKPSGYGTGLGLSQVYGFAVQSGGGVEIDSTLGHGTLVTVFLPCAEAAPPGSASGGTSMQPRPATQDP
jgi:signal transduction histidine kinase